MPSILRCILQTCTWRFVFLNSPQPSLAALFPSRKICNRKHVSSNDITLHFADLQSQTCLFERYYAAFCPARGGSFPRCNCKFQLNSSQPSLAACVSREGERSSFLFPSTRPLTTHTETREFGPPSGRSVLGDHFRWNRAAEIQPQPVVTYMHTAPESLPRGGSRTPRAPPAPSRRSRRARAEARRAPKGL